MPKIFTDCGTVRLLVVSLTCGMAVPCAAQQYGFPKGLIKNSATLSRALPRLQERATQVVAGMKIELTLAPPDEHVYTAQLENGAALIAEVDQAGIDLVIDVYDPDGRRLSRLDSPNGTQGPEPIDFTALRSGTYKFVVRAIKKDAKPGKYVMKVNQILGPVENAKRLAKDRYPTKALYDLWETSLADPKAVERFIDDHKQSGPIIEAIPGNSLEKQVTYFCLGDQDTERVVLVGGPDYMGLEMNRLGRTNLFFARQMVPNDSHYSILPGPKSVVAAGSSLGGYCATYCAFTHPEVIGNVISQSGSYWISKNWQTVEAHFAHRLYPRDTGALIEEFKTSKRLPIRFYMEVGIYDLGAAMLGSNRELRDVLQLKGYDVDYHEFIGGHNFVNWRGSLADGLISLLGRRRTSMADSRK